MDRTRGRVLGLSVANALVALLLVTSSSFAFATIVSVATDSAVGKFGLAMPGGQNLIKDLWGNYIAVYAGSDGSLSIVVANDENPTAPGVWGAPTKSPMPAVAYRRPAAVLTSPLSMRILAEGGAASGNIADIPVTLTRDLWGNIETVTYGTPGVLARSAQYVSAIVAHDGSVIAVWNSAVVGVSSTVFSSRWTVVTGWRSVSNLLSSGPDTVILDTSDSTAIQPNVVERPDNFALIVVGNRGEPSTQTTLVFNSGTFQVLGWSWGAQNLAYEADASRGVADATDLAWDPVRAVVVVTYDLSRESRYAVIRIDAAGSKVRVDTSHLVMTNNEWGSLLVDPANGDYYLFTMDTPLSPPWGEEYGNVTYTRRTNEVWSSRLITIDGGGDSMGISPRRAMMFGAGNDGSLEVLVGKGKAAPATINFIRLNP